jgi:hypothetical protein
MDLSGDPAVAGKRILVAGTLIRAKCEYDYGKVRAQDADSRIDDSDGNWGAGARTLA